MEKISLPKKIEFIEGKDKNESQVVIGPCYPGYGITLGNAIRRVLLSSLPGAAVVGVKIEGVDHEFMTIPHLKEDVLEFILNIKKIKLKIFSKETEKLELKVHGKKEIKASDISKNSNVEIVNGDLVLGNITDMAGQVKMEIFVSEGMGYETLESRESSSEKKEKQLGYIEMDSIFSPVLAAGLRVENVRVGKMTNWDSLIISIRTDGTITPKEAFNESVTILINQFNALVTEENSEKKEKKDKTEEKETEKKSKKEKK